MQRLGKDKTKSEWRYYTVYKTHLGRRLHAMTSVHAPKLGVDTLAKNMYVASAGTFENLGVSLSYLPALSYVTLSSATINKLVIELGVDIVVLISKDIQETKLSLICDKGDGKRLSVSFIKPSS